MTLIKDNTENNYVLNILMEVPEYTLYLLHSNK